MKKIFVSFLIIIGLFFSFSSITYSTDCKYSDGSSLSDSLGKCLSDSSLVKWDWDLTVTEWFRNYITKWTNNIALYLWVLAVFWIALWSLMLVISTWEEDKVSKAKTIIKWSIIWFVAVITASFIINLIIRIMYSSTLTSIIWV